VLRCPKKAHVTDTAPARLAYGAAVDVWAVGVLLWELLVGAAPFAAATREATKRNVASRTPPLPTWPPRCRAFVAACLERAPSQRPSAEGLLQHPWLLDPREGGALAEG